MLQMDVFNTFIELLRQTGNVTKGQNDMNELRQVNFYVLLVSNVNEPLPAFSYCSLASSSIYFLFIYLTSLMLRK